MRRDVGAALPFLPIPDKQGTDEFIELYRRKFDVELSYDDACEILGGLMRFLYLTRVKQRDGEAGGEEPDHAASASGEMQDINGNGSLP